MVFNQVTILLKILIVIFWFLFGFVKWFFMKTILRGSKVLFL